MTTTIHDECATNGLVVGVNVLYLLPRMGVGGQACTYKHGSIYPLP